MGQGPLQLREHDAGAGERRVEEEQLPGEVGGLSVFLGVLSTSYMRRLIFVILAACTAGAILIGCHVSPGGRFRELLKCMILFEICRAFTRGRLYSIHVAQLRPPSTPSSTYFEQ